MATCARTSIKTTECNFRNNMMFQSAVVSGVTNGAWGSVGSGSAIRSTTAVDAGQRSEYPRADVVVGGPAGPTNNGKTVCSPSGLPALPQRQCRAFRAPQSIPRPMVFCRADRRSAIPLSEADVLIAAMAFRFRRRGSGSSIRSTSPRWNRGGGCQPAKNTRRTVSRAASREKCRWTLSRPWRARVVQRASSR